MNTMRDWLNLIERLSETAPPKSPSEDASEVVDEGARGGDLAGPRKRPAIRRTAIRRVEALNDK